jgi:uncharacterized protein with HEPN domain
VAEIVARGKIEFLADTILQRAMERLLEIIGEAANALSDESRVAFPGVPWRDIMDLRILLAHHYFRIDEEQVWIIASASVPELLEQIQH